MAMCRATHTHAHQRRALCRSRFDDRMIAFIVFFFSSRLWVCCRLLLMMVSGMAFEIAWGYVDSFCFVIDETEYKEIIDAITID